MGNKKKLTALVTAGPTKERIDPVRYLTNDSSGKQGYAIAGVLASLGIDVVLVSGESNEKVPEGVSCVRVESASEMLLACQEALPVDIAICVAAVADWMPVECSTSKIKKQEGQERLFLELQPTPDILRSLCMHVNRPEFVVGFAAETDNLLVNARKKISDKGCDMLVVNDIASGVFGSDVNKVSILTSDGGVDHLDIMSKQDVARGLIDKILGCMSS